MSAGARFAGALLVLAVLLSGAGCHTLIGPMMYFFGPPRNQEAEFRLTEKGRVAILIEFVRSDQEKPVFASALHQALLELAKEKRPNLRFVPYQEYVELRQHDPEFPRMSVQRVGRALYAEQVVYMQVEDLQTFESPNSPVLMPACTINIRVIGVKEPPEKARLWPEDAAGAEVSYRRPPRAMESIHEADTALVKLAKDTAQHIIKRFVDTDPDIRPPRER